MDSFFQMNENASVRQNDNKIKGQTIITITNKKNFV